MNDESGKVFGLPGNSHSASELIIYPDGGKVERPVLE